jgi:hypothetical protein
MWPPRGSFFCPRFSRLMRHVSADRTAATFILVTPYGSEIVVTMPARCLDTLEPRDRATAAGTAGNGGNSAVGCALPSLAQCCPVRRTFPLSEL